jgi:hypothetical protein
MPTAPGAFLVIAACLAGAGCAGAQASKPSASAPAFTAAAPVRRAPSSAQRSPGARLVEKELRARGLKFGSDGTMTALYFYMRERHQPIAPSQARPGDIVFFDLAVDDGTGGDCGAHGGVVEEVDPEGRIAFREARGGTVRQSYLHPGEPATRRDPRGRLLNTFLRPRRPDDPPATRYYAGEMLCAVIRPRTTG